MSKDGSDRNHWALWTHRVVIFPRCHLLLRGHVSPTPMPAHPRPSSAHAVEKVPRLAPLPPLMQGPPSPQVSPCLGRHSPLLSEIPHSDRIWPNSQPSIRQKKKAARADPRIWKEELWLGVCVCVCCL